MRLYEKREKKGSAWLFQKEKNQPVLLCVSSQILVKHVHSNHVKYILASSNNVWSQKKKNILVSQD